MWELFKDKNEYNEKNIIGFYPWYVLCIRRRGFSNGYYWNRTNGKRLHL